MTSRALFKTLKTSRALLQHLDFQSCLATRHE